MRLGRKYVSLEMEQMLRTVQRHPNPDGANKFQGLSSRELQVVKLILEQMSTEEIAKVLFLSPSTVETHRRNILQKLDCRNTAGLVKYAVERGWASNG